jgi:hypothetical protein
MISITGICHGSMVTAQKETDRTIIYRDYVEIIALDDGNTFIQVGEHWLQVEIVGHAEWCGCSYTAYPYKVTVPPLKVCEPKAN